jgi:uncharacterized protein (DUF58 family)
MAFAASSSADLLSPTELSRLDRLATLTRGRGVGYAGSHRSPLPGHGVAFVDRRRYEPGDDPRAVDWRLLGRTDRLYVRRFEREADMGVALLVDDSASMTFAGLHPHAAALSKHAHALRLAAAIGYLALRRRDRVVVAAQRGRQMQPAASLPRLTAILQQQSPGADGHALAASIADVAARLGRHTTLVVFSDLLEPIEPIRRAVAWSASRGLHVVLWQVLHAHEWRLPPDTPAGTRRVIDPETRTGPRVDLRTLRPRYVHCIDSFVAAWSRAARDCSAAHALYRSDQNLVDRLAAWLHAPPAARALHTASLGRGGIAP